MYFSSNFGWYSFDFGIEGGGGGGGGVGGGGVI